MSTPITPFPRDTYTNIEPERPVSVEVNPDDPPWGVGIALSVWLASIALMLAIPTVAVIPYILYGYSGAELQQLDQLLSKDPNVLLIGIAATVPTHLATLAIVWAVVTGLRKRSFWRTIGWGWGHNFGLWKSVLAAVLLLLGAMVVAALLGVNKTPFDEMLESSTAALFATAFLATATAPLIEELVYRGVLYSALQRAVGAVWAILIVAFLFASVHFWQYKTSPGTIGAIVFLSLGLTCVRAATGRVLPCIVIHLVFNGLQVAYMIFRFFRPETPVVETATALLALIRSPLFFPL